MRFAALEREFSLTPFRHVVEQDRHAPRRRVPNAHRVYVVPPAECSRIILELRSSTSPNDLAEGIEPILLVPGRNITDPMANGVPNSGLPFERRVDLNNLEITGTAARIEQDLQDAKASLDGLDQYVITRFLIFEPRVHRVLFAAVVHHLEVADMSAIFSSQSGERA